MLVVVEVANLLRVLSFLCGFFVVSLWWIDGDCGEFVVACVVVKNAPFFGIVSREAVRWRRAKESR
jgi:hypothetical protein